MARISDLAKGMADSLALPPMTAIGVGNRLQGAGLLPKGTRGIGARMTDKDGGLLLTTLLGMPRVTDAVETAKRYAGVRAVEFWVRPPGGHPFAGPRLRLERSILGIEEGTSLVEAVVGMLANLVENGGRLLLHLGEVEALKLAVSRPWPGATLEVKSTKADETLFIVFSHEAHQDTGDPARDQQALDQLYRRFGYQPGMLEWREIKLRELQKIAACLAIHPKPRSAREERRVWS